MANISRMKEYETRWRDYEYFDNVADTFKTYMIVDVTVHTFFILAGIIINVWFLTAMLLSSEIRSRMRNKIISAVLVVNLVESLTLIPFTAVQGIMDLLKPYEILDCKIWTAYHNIYHILDFVGNWYILILACVYTAQVFSFEPKFTPRWIQISTALIIATTPCMFALFFVPLTIKSSSYPNSDCLDHSSHALKVYKSLDTIVPLALTILILVVTAVCKHRHSHYQRFPTFSARLIDDRSQTDPWYPFVAVLIVAVMSDITLMFLLLDWSLIDGLHSTISLSVYIVALVLSYLRVLLLPVVMLMFPDIRERIKTWRPCGRSAPPVDLVVTYEKNAA